MRTSTIRLAFGVLLLAGATSIATLVSGCLAPLAVGAAAGYGALTYANGDLNGVAHANVDRTWRATLVTADQLGLAIQEQRKEVTRANLRALQADRTEVRITLERRSGDFTRINIRVGFFGDEIQSKAILEAIKKNL